MIFFTSDEHYGHANIIKYCSRPFSSVIEMDDVIIENHNSIVKPGDVIYHLGDFTLSEDADQYIRRLHGKHVFIKGSHDYWLPNGKQLLEITIENRLIVLCHYAMRVWARSHYNSCQLYGHSHGQLPPQGKQWDVGVDNNNFYPVSYDQVVEIMEKQPNNFNLVATPKKGE